MKKGIGNISKIKITMIILASLFVIPSLFFLITIGIMAALDNTNNDEYPVKFPIYDILQQKKES